ncbi:hypothetical protein VHEMI09251 [[Torrubiella] hemipterigena]|nr:hypothetical protein VHEMI09251 [[Torrubiella] hemipterigena]
MTTSEAITHIKSTMFKDEDNKILDWLASSSYGSKYSDLLKDRQPGTGQWFLDSAEYQTWLGTQKQTLFCPGIPGAGKTILASIVIEDLFSRFESNQEIGIAYLYCDFQRQDNQKVDDLLASLLRQLAQRRPSLPDELKSLYKKHKDIQTRPSVDEILSGLESVARIYSRVLIVVDALDECEMKCMLKFLSHLFSLQASTMANILATSRPIEIIKKEFEGRSEIVNISARNEDVEKYLDSDMKMLRLLDKGSDGLSDKRREELQKEIKNTLIKCVNGMFLLARLHLASLVDKTSEFALCTALKSLPKGQNALAQAYGLTIKRIRSQPEGWRSLAERVLTLLTCAKSQLTTLELQDALAVTEGDSRLDKTKRELTNTIVLVCAGLVTVDAYSGIIRLVHETTREYFASHMHCIRPQKAVTNTEDPMKLDDEKNASATVEAHRTFAIICISYLSFSDFDSGFCQTDAAFEQRLRSNQLYKYAACNWGYHAHEASTLCPNITWFLEDSPKVEASSQALMATDSWRSNWSQLVPKRVTGIHLAAYFGLQESVRILLQDWQNIDVRDDWGRTSLLYAARNGYEATVQLLLATEKVDVNAKDKWGRTPLSYTAENGHESIVKLLLASDKVDVNTQDQWGQTLLSYAAEGGHEAVVNLLLATDKVAVDTQDQWGRSPLSYAAMKGHQAMVKLLLMTDKVDIDTQDRWGRMPLSYAVENGHETVVKLLLDRDADVNITSNGDWTPLNYASRTGYINVVKLLLNKGANIDALTKCGRTSLHYSSYYGFVDVVEILLICGIHHHTMDIHGRSPLFMASISTNNHSAVVRCLLSYGVLPDVADRYGTTPLFAAIKHENIDVARLLLATKAVDLTVKDGFGKSLGYWAARSKNRLVIDLLSHHGVLAGALPELDSNVISAPKEYGSLYCDICVGRVAIGQSYRRCEICDIDEFSICQECYEAGFRCHEGTHELSYIQSYISS